MRSRWTLAFVAALLSSLSAVAAAHDFILWPRPARLDAPGVVELGKAARLDDTRALFGSTDLGGE